MIPLPPAFAERLQAYLGESADAFFAAMEQPPVRGLRVNPDKTPENPLSAAALGIGDAVPWAADGRVLSSDSGAGAHPLHACGAYYLQEPSAMLPAALLCPKPGETVLDLCAAPGGKSTQLAAAMGGIGTLVCNEIVPARAAVLAGNLERMGVRNAIAVSADAAALAKRWPKLFDAILVDAPCSGEGMFRKSLETRLEWDAGAPARCARRQAHILENAAAMLKAGGRLCYSTCTFSEEENEGAISAFLERHPEFEPAGFTVPLGGGRAAASRGGCVRLYPHEIRGEGHFAALLVKTGASGGEVPPAACRPANRALASPDAQTLESYSAFWKEVSAAEPPCPNAMIGNLLISAPPLPPLDGLKAYRAGLSLGRLKGRVFLPDHALALAAPTPALRSIGLDEQNAALYLRGEVLPSDTAEGGFYAVTYLGLPLGFVKNSDGQLKNHYPKGLRQR